MQNNSEYPQKVCAPSSGMCSIVAYTDRSVGSKGCCINLLAPELFFLILAHPVYKM